MRILNDNYFTYRQTPVDYDGIAKIDSIKGNSVAFNQLRNPIVKSETYSGVTQVITADGKCVFTNTSTVANVVLLANNVRATLNHKYLLKVTKQLSSGRSLQIRYSSDGTTDSGGAVSNITDTMIYTHTNSSYSYLLLRYYFDANVQTNDTFYLSFYDLTQMGLDTITSPSQFTDLFPLPYYSYTLGTLVSFNGTGIKTVGFNQWDEEWELGRYNLTTGVPESVNTQIRSKNSISVFPNTEYYFYTTSSAYVLYYDGGGNFISAIACNGSRTFTTPSNCNIIKFYMFSAYGTEYNNDVCINISSSTNGTYEPYTEKSASLPISSYFPTGMKSANTVYDEISNGKAITRLNKYTFTGNETISVSSDLGTYYRAEIQGSTITPDIKNLGSTLGGYAQAISSFAPFKTDYSEDSLHFYFFNNTWRLFLPVSSDAEALTYLTGKEIIYEIATPTEADFKEDIYYYFFDKGTEQLLPVNTSTPSTTPLLADIIYYDTREGETPYRKFWMINTKGDRWNLTERDFKSFLNNPQNLGYSKTITVNRYGNAQNLVDVTDNFPQPSGEIIFYDSANSSRYEKYNRLIDFLSYYPITLYYQLPFTFFSQIPNIYTLECVAVSLGKTESKTDGMMTCPITFNGLSFYKGDTVEINGSGSTYTLNNEGDFPVGFEITIKGSLENPYFTLEQDGELYGEAKFDDSTAFGEVYVDSIDGEQNIILKQGGSVLVNPLGYRDLSISNGSIYVTFVKLQRGESTLTIGYDSGSITSVDVSFTPIYRSV